MSTTPDPEVLLPMLRRKLVILSGSDAGRSFALQVRSYRLGTDPACDIVLNDRTVSRQHLSLEVREDRVLARDLGSRNGSFCERMRFRELELRMGAILRLGATELKVVPKEVSEHIIPLSSDTEFGGLVGGSRRMREVFTLLQRVASGDGDVLIQGETGTGKELCAAGIHAASPRSRGPFGIVDVAGITPSLMESELFGHVKGAFTGAHSERPGAFEQADGGTVFLDEVGELPLEFQPRLLRVLEGRQVKRVGANEYRTVNVRVVAATHRDLEADVKEGRFREDLFHRLAVLRVTLPPLRERPEDIPLLVDTMLERLGRPPSALSEQTRALLEQYPWPGNVRELRNVVQRVVNLGEHALPEMSASERARFTSAELEMPFKEAKERLIDGFERDYLKNLLERCGGNISRASREAGLARLYVRKLLKKYGLHASKDSE
ncbi:sigma 54-interacting transcriptional regulator [Myxococcus landrumensis]|uniref:Sigma 54-interacting transcriptional regulator n=1 Tax=Myxococcus landrumensis TaxID=2813577 RepID=A0ABX7NLE4_9BACT|nr:sigma 54-interacting transcriptional regulator [Myxococcus landrumus]QSQ18304.1 sigma 54-interacting transcriptional regulator [Myxococcus landrumus]